MFVCLLNELILGFSYSDLTLETGGFELASTITLVLQANRILKIINMTFLSLLFTQHGSSVSSKKQKICSFACDFYRNQVCSGKVDLLVESVKTNFVDIDEKRSGRWMQ